MSDNSNNLRYKIANALLSFGSTKGKSLPEAISNGALGYVKARNDINSFNAYKPYFDQMGINTDQLNPLMGGAGFGDVDPSKLIQYQYYGDLLNARKKYYEGKNNKTTENNEIPVTNKQAGKTITYGNLMKISPSFKANLSGQYDFSNGQNNDLLNATMPESLARNWIPKQPTQINYGGGTNSSKNVTTTSNGRKVVVHEGGFNDTKNNLNKPKAQGNNPAVQAETREYQGYRYTKGKDGKWHRGKKI